MKPSFKPALDGSVEEHPTEPSSIAWHPAFVEALQMELEDYRDYLEFHPEYQLTSEPLRIDCVVIKKAPDLVIKKNIAAIFREANLLEYKSPDDYISVADFYKVYGYACLYTSFEKAPVTGISISFVESRYPKELLGHLRKTRGYKVEETSSGIYTVKGDILPIQIIDSRRLSAEENLWLRDLDNKLEANETRRLILEIERKGKVARIQAYINAIARANYKAVKEAIDMSDAVKSLDDVFVVTGLAARWEAKAEAKGAENKALEVARNMINFGIPLETIVAVTKLETETVKKLFMSKEANDW